MTLAPARTGAPAVPPTPPGLRPLGRWGFAAVVVASFGGPLALAALYAPQAVDEVASSAGLVALAAAVLFVAPLAVWVRYARVVPGAGGLYGFVREAAGARTATVQAVLWTTSYLLYLVYTTAYVVYDVLPEVVPRVARYRSLLEVVLPVVIAAVVVAGRRVTIATIAAIAIAQVSLVALLDVVAARHGTTSTAFAGHGQPHATAVAAGSIALLFVCGSLPLFFGGEVVRPRRSMPRLLPAVFAATAVAVVVAVLPMALDPAFTHAEIPGMALVRADVGRTAADAIGLGVAASVVGLMLVEYLALTRLLYAVTGRAPQRIAWWLAVPLVAAGPISLINPDRFYADLLKPSLVALWLSQLIVVAVYPLFARRQGSRLVPHVALGTVASGVMVFGLWTTLSSSVAT